MAKCEICEKTAIHGNKLSITRSHISKRAPRTWKPNLRTVKANVDGEIKRIDRTLCEQAVYNATQTGAISCIQGQIAQLQSLTKLVVPNTSVCPGY